MELKSKVRPFVSCFFLDCKYYAEKQLHSRLSMSYVVFNPSVLKKWAITAYKMSIQGVQMATSKYCDGRTPNIPGKFKVDGKEVLMSIAQQMW